MSKNLIKVNTESEVLEAQKNLEEPFVILVKDTNKLIYQDDSHCDAIILIDDWNSYNTELPVIQKDISWIKGRRCLVKKTKDGVAICYLDENNSELFHDGTTPAKLDGSMGMWMSDLPEFNIQCIQGDSDWVKLHISKDKEIGHKSRRVLLGVTKGRIGDGNNLSAYKNKLTSLKLETELYPTGYKTIFDFRSASAYAFGGGFDIIDYETHCKLAYMYMAKYKNKDVSKSFNINYGNACMVGLTAGSGNNDKTDIPSSIFGVEQPFDGCGEFMSGITTYFNLGKSSLEFCIADGLIFNSSLETVTIPYRLESIDVAVIMSEGNPSGYGTSGFISRIKYGEHADLIPTETSGSAKYFYPDYTEMNAGVTEGCVTRILLHTQTGESLDRTGIFGFNQIDQHVMRDWLTSRLQYRGNIQVIEDPQEFINLPLGF